MREALREPLVKSLNKLITQAGHGFELLAPVYWNGTAWVRSYANVIAQSNTVGVVTRVIDANRFEITESGEFALPDVAIKTTLASPYGYYSTSLSANGQYQVTSTLGNGVFVSSDYGQSWVQPVSVPSGANARSSSISASGQYMIIGIQNGNGYLSTDYGVTWNTFSLPVGTFTTTAAVHMSSSGQYLVATGNSGVYKSTDYGATWTLTSMQGWHAAISDDGQTIVATDGYNISSQARKSTDGGLTFSNIGPSIRHNDFKMSSNGQYMIFPENSGSTTPPGNIWVSADYGASWTAKLALGDYRGVGISRNGKYQIASGFSNSIFVSQDYGNTWTDQNKINNYIGSGSISDDGNNFTIGTWYALAGLLNYKGFGLFANTIRFLTESGTVGDVPTTTGYVKKPLIVGTSGNSGIVNIGDSEIIGQIATDIISENTPDTGVTVDGVKMKDGQVYTDQINELTPNSGVTADGVKMKDAGVIQDSAITRKSGFSDTIVANTLYKIGTMTMGADSRHVMLRGFLWVYGNATIEFNVFIRSSTLPSKDVYYHTVEYNQSQDISIEVWDDPATDSVHIGFKTANTSLSARWEVTEIGRQLYDGWINATTMSVLATAGLTQITESGVTFYQTVQQFIGGIKTETIDPIASSNSIAIGGTGSAVVPNGTTIQRPATPSNGMIRFNTTTNSYEAYYNGAWGAFDAPIFRIHSISGSTAVIGGGTMMLSNGDILVTGNGILESMLGVNISVNLDVALGGPPADATTYYLYIDRYKLPAAITVVDSGRLIIRVTNEANFSVLTTDPANTDLYRYVPVGYIRSATTGNAWTGAGAMFGFPRLTFHALNDFVAIPEKYTTTINTAAVHTLSHGLSSAPSIIQLYYWDGTGTIALDVASYLSDKTDSSLVISTVGLTFSSGEYVSVVAFFVPSYANQITSNVTQFKSQWFENTSTTTVPHGLSDAEDIKGYSVIEWDTTTGRYRSIPASGLVIDYDHNNLYLDWSGFTPSSTLKYQIVTGGHPVPTSVPTFVGGYTKFVGAGPGSYDTLTTALAASAPGDSILVTRGYSISAAETVSINGVKITFMPNIKIIQTAATTGLIVAANDVTIDMPSYEFTASGSITDAISVTGDDCVISKCRLVINNAGLTVTNGLNLSAASERNEVSASIKKTAGTVTNSVVDLGTDNLPLVRG